MSILKVSRLGNPVLRRQSDEVSRETLAGPVIQTLIDNMIVTMVEYHGVGLAAPQVHEGLRVFVAAISSDADDPLPPESEPMVFVNPIITPVGPDIVEEWEGCLSIPDLRGRVPRAREVKVSGWDRSGGRLDVHTQGFPARVIQHETDHLDGILFFDRMKSLDTLSYLDEYARYWSKDRDQ